MADNKDLSFDLAKWFAAEVGKRPSAQQNVLVNGKENEVRRIYGPVTDRLIAARDAWRQQSAQGVHIPIPEGPHQSDPEHFTDISATDVATAGILGAMAIGPKNYMELTEEAEAAGRSAYEKWEKEQASLSKNPNTKLSPDRANNANEAYIKAKAEVYDKFISKPKNLQRASKWQKEHPENGALGMSLIRHDIRQTGITHDNFLELREKYAELAGKSFENLTPEQIEELKSKAIEEANRILAEQNPGLASQIAKEDEERKAAEEKKKEDEGEQKKEGEEEKTEETKSTETESTQTAETSTERSKRLQKEAIESLRTQGAASPYAQRGGSTDDAWGPSQPPTPNPSQNQSSLPRIPDRRWGGSSSMGRHSPRIPGGVRGIAKGARVIGFIFSPPGLAILGTIAVVVFVFLVLAHLCQLTAGWPLREKWAPILHQVCGSSSDPTILPPPEGVSIVTTGPEDVGNGQPIAYTIKMEYDKTRATVPIEDMTLISVPDFAHEFESANPPVTRVRGTAPRNNYAWDLATVPKTEAGNIITVNISLTIRPTVENARVSNGAYIETVGSGGELEGTDSRPTANACVNTQDYRGIMSAISNDFSTPASNFGDPICSYTRENLRVLLERQDPNNADFWMDIAQCESGSNGPNAYGRQDDEGNSDSVEEDIREGERHPETGLYKGTWGLFQMGRSYPNPFKERGEDTNNQRGDVTWQRQVENAVSYNRERAREGNNFVYWEAAYCLCGTSRHSGKPYCADIERKNLDRSCSSCN